MSASAVERQRISELEELVATLQEENYFLRQRASKGSAIRVVNHYEQEPPFPSTKLSGSEAAPPAHRPPSGENLNNLQNPLLKSSAAPVQELSQFASQHVGAAFTPADPETGSTLNVNHDSPSDDFLVNQQDPSWTPGASGPTAASTIAADEEWFKFRPRALWLIGLLCLQSTSSFVLAGFKDLIQRHPSIVYFLTMLVGAGGNAGGQAVVYAVRRLALNKPVDTAHQIKIGFLLAAALSAATAVRTAVQRITSFHTGCALSGAMFFIVLFAVAFGTSSAAL